MTYLIDSNVLSEATKPNPTPAVPAWVVQHEHESMISSVTLGELRLGILRLPSGKKKQALTKWFLDGVERFPVVDFDADAALVWAEMLAGLQRRGQAMPIKDSLIAAIAICHGLTLVTRNTRDFEGAPVKLLNPFED